MAAPSFPAPPDLSELLRYFASTYDTSTGIQQRQQPSAQRQHDRGAQPHVRRWETERQRQRSSKAKQQQEASVKQHLQRHQRQPPSREASSRQPETSDWNGSTQVPAAVTKPLKHQILDRTFQPPTPVLVDASGTTHLLQRLSKTTVSSRLKSHHQTDREAALATATVVIANAFERRTQRHLPTNARASVRERRYEADDTTGESQTPSRVTPDSRARDGIQTLLMYRREVEKRLSADPTHFPSH